ncbi:MAG: acyl-CoA dehydrogenase [Syntrophomonadaceae bacterium]|nr:acyl-CoA dehydrogenase [Syntrophomonadaceae bacterium]
MPHNNYLYQMRDIKFQMKEWLDMEKLLSCDGYKDYYGVDDLDGFLDVNFKICRDVLCPANKDSDEIGFQFVGGNENAVKSPDVFKTVYNTVCEAGLGPQFGDREVEGRMPLAWYAPILEMQSGASPAMVMLWSLTQGATTVIQYNAAQRFKDLYLPKMYTGEWGGSMCLTEPGAGSDVGAVQTKCFPTDTPGLWKIKGQKCFITTGDNDCVSNIIHLVLAKDPDAKPGTAGISCLMVPKYWVDDDGNMTKWNDVTTIGLEHKLGIHGSATAALAFGENDDCYGWMIGDGPVDGRGKGMAQMFQMMNEERINTGLFSQGVIGAAYYSALDYAKVRVQSRKATDPKGPAVRIIEHEDVRRMLMLQKSIMEACRAMVYSSYYYIDMGKEASTEEERDLAEDFFMIQNPICKAFISDMAWAMTSEAMQVHGGYGFMEEYAPASLARDCKIYSIWEGTNFMHGQDLTGRKYTMKGGEPFKKWLALIEDFLNNKKIAELDKEFAMMADAFAAFKTMMDLNGNWIKEHFELKQLYATRMLHSAAKVLGGRFLLEQAVIAAQKLAELGEDHFDANFYKSKIATARFFVMNVVPEVFGVLKSMQHPDTSCIDLAEEAFM